MKYYLDTEFAERQGSIDLISIALINEHSEGFYAVLSEGWSRSSCNDWVRKNVLPHLKINSGDWVSRDSVKGSILELVGNDSSPEFWGYYADYDWVVFCWLFGAMVDLPPGWPMYCNDLRQLQRELGDPDLPYSSDKHNAMIDVQDLLLNHRHLIRLKDERSALPGIGGRH